MHKPWDTSNKAGSLQIPDHCVIEEPVYIVHKAELAPKNLISIGENSQATIIEISLHDQQAPHTTNTVTHITLSKNARLTHVFLQSGSDNSIQLSTLTIDQHQHSHYAGHLITIGGLLNQTSLAIDFTEPYATAELRVLTVAKACAAITVDLTMQHHTPHCESRIVSRGVIKDRAKSDFTGKILIQENAIKTKAALENKNLLLSSEAVANTRPQLEIYNDDVECSHGATVGSEDTEALFYLISRGIPILEARQLLIDGFLAPCLQNLSSSILPYVESLIHEPA